MDQTTRPERPAGPLTLAIDVGGTRLKAGILATTGHMTAGPRRIDTPHPATPEAVIDGLVGLVGSLGPFERISIGFPGVVRDGLVLTAPNLGTTAWHGFPLAATLAKKLRAPARLANDATVQGLGVISGHGVECVITLGTGMGFALFENARPAPHLELSQHPARGRKTYDQYIGNALAGRQVAQHMREIGMTTGGPAALTRADRSRFLSALDAAVQAAISGRASPA